MMQERPTIPHEIQIDVQPSDIDELGHVNNVVYLRWVQEAATAHWRVLATGEQQDSLLWVVRKHEIEYKRAALAGDTLVARTWVGTAAGRTFERHTEILRKADNKLLARARTLWTPIDRETGRSVHPGPDVYALFSASNNPDR
ncbi:MAG: acyl-CoA thioesterase [Gammaproteobacteria bacterium]